jgi:pyruvate dehydrogenase E1 component beta subunit
MAQLPFIAAIDAGIHQEMRRDPSVLYFGQNMATTENHEFVKAFGHDRVRVTPISETAEIGIAIGAAMAGLRPVVELYMAEFMLVAMDQVVNEAPRFRYMSGGQVKVPLVLKAGFGFACGWAGQHTGSLTALFMGVPGLKVVVPSTAADAKGLMATAIRDDNPVVFLHHYLLTLEMGEVPDGEHLVPFGEAEIRRPGGDVTIVATGWMAPRSLAAAEKLAKEGIQAEVIDPARLRRSISPPFSNRSPRPGDWSWSIRRRATRRWAELLPAMSPSMASRRSKHRSCKSPPATRRCPTANLSKPM